MLIFFLALLLPPSTDLLFPQPLGNASQLYFHASLCYHLDEKPWIRAPCRSKHGIPIKVPPQTPTFSKTAGSISLHLGSHLFQITQREVEATHKMELAAGFYGSHGPCVLSNSAREVEAALEMELAAGLYGRNWKTEDAGKVASNRLVKARERTDSWRQEGKMVSIGIEGWAP